MSIAALPPNLPPFVSPSSPASLASTRSDIESVRALADALVAFGGAVVFVSHDESFCRAVANELWLCDGSSGSVSRLHCGFDGYKATVKASLQQRH